MSLVGFCVNIILLLLAYKFVSTTYLYLAVRLSLEGMDWKFHAWNHSGWNGTYFRANQSIQMSSFSFRNKRHAWHMIWRQMIQQLWWSQAGLGLGLGGKPHGNLMFTAMNNFRRGGDQGINAMKVFRKVCMSRSGWLKGYSSSSYRFHMQFPNIQLFSSFHKRSPFTRMNQSFIFNVVPSIVATEQPSGALQSSSAKRMGSIAHIN